MLAEPARTIDPHHRGGYRGPMRIRIGHELTFEIARPTPMLLMLHVHPDAVPALRQPEAIQVDPAAELDTFVDWFGNRAARIVAPAGRLRLRYDNVVEDSGRPEATIEGQPLRSVPELPPAPGWFST